MTWPMGQRAPVVPPVLPGTIPALITFLQALPADSDVTDWELRRDEVGDLVTLTVSVLFAPPDAWREREEYR